MRVQANRIGLDMNGKHQLLKFEREKFYPGPGIEPCPLALRASALPLRHAGQLLIQGRINLFESILSDLRTANSVVAQRDQQLSWMA